jgi:hypothetical protein
LWKVGGEEFDIYFVKNKYTYSIEDSRLCWFWCISFLIDPPSSTESASMGMTKARHCFYDFYGSGIWMKLIKKKKVNEYVGFMLVEENDFFRYWC